MIDYIKFNDCLLAIIVKNNFKHNGIKFFTDNKFSQQLGYMNRRTGYIIEPHFHKIINRNVQITQEVLIIKSGKIRTDFYSDQQEYIESRILLEGDILLLAHGGHGFEMLEDSEIIEVKQGPYCGEEDKVRFTQVDKENIIIKE